MQDDERDDLQDGGILDVLSNPLGIVRRRWRWMVAALLAALLATTAFVSLQKPRYLASATLLVAAQQIREDLVRTTLEDDLLQRIDSIVAETLSRENLAPLIEKHDPYPDLRHSRSMSELADMVRTDVTFESLDGIEARRDATVRMFRLSFEADRPEIAASFANVLAGAVVDRSIRRRTEEAGLAMNFLRRELERAENEMAEQTRAIRELKEKHRGELPGELPANLARLDRLQQQRQSLALQIAEANTRLASLLTGQTAQAEQTPETRLATLRAELEKHEGSLTPKHPEVQWLKRQIAALEAELGVPDGEKGAALPTRSGLIAASQQTVDELRRQLARTEVELADLDARVARTPARQEELAALEERESAARENYRDLLRKVQEGALAKSLESAQQGERFSVIDEAIAPASPTRSRTKYLAAGFLASFGLAFGVGLLLEALDPVLVTARQAETDSGLPVLGSVPHLPLRSID